jgi:23S rRNA (uracil1939-C5)-methyltransferase
LNPAAVADAKENAKKNGVENISFRAGDAGEYLLRQAAEGKNLPNVVIMDPPRSGSSKEFIQALQKIRPERIVYVSCGPQSLARDLGFLLRPKHGKRLYRVESIQPCDMFPMTNHCEVILCLSQNFT